jgi:transposase-like protein
MNLLNVTTNLQTDDQCLDFLERTRWTNGHVRCIRCGGDKISRIARKVNPTKKNQRTRLYTCLEPTCKHQFSTTTGTMFHDSHLPLNKWFMAIALIVHAKKGMSAMQMQRHLQVSYRTAWFMGHRIRKSMAENSGSPLLSGTVEIDETYIGGKTIRKKERGNLKGQKKAAVVGMIERGGSLRLRHVGTGNTTSAQVAPLVRQNVAREVERVMTDESTIYPVAFDGYCASKHETIAHKYEYVRGDIHTNTIESAFSLFKRGVNGSFHRVSHKHLHRYLSEFEYRFNRRNQMDIFEQAVGQMSKPGNMPYAELIAN